jgi:hypothetical protein
MSMISTKTVVNRRKKLLIEPRFQIGFLAHTISGAFMSSAIFYAANRYFFWRFADYGRQAGLPANHVFFRFLQTQQNHMDHIFAGTVIFLCCALTLYGLAYSNRVAGPIFHLRGYLRSYAKGNTHGEIRFRKNDLFKDLEPLVNNALRAKESQKKAG